MTIQELLEENTELRNALLALREIFDDALDDLDPEVDHDQDVED